MPIFFLQIWGSIRVLTICTLQSAYRHSGAPNSYLGYDYLGNLLASRGYICASVALNELWQGWRIHHRGLTILEHVRTMLSNVTSDVVINNVRTRMDNLRVGLIGHSRGGEGVVAAQNIYSGLASPGYTIKAVASYSPTDGPNWSETSPGGGPYDPGVVYMMIYGSRDGDVRGYAGNTGYRIMDRGQHPKYSITLNGGNHNYFNTTWASDGSPTISRAQQENQGKALLSAFLNAYVLNQQAYVALLQGHTVPNSINSVGNTVLYSSQPAGWGVRLVIDDAQDAPVNASQNSLGNVNINTGLTAFVEEGLRYRTTPQRNYYTHDTDGLRMRWNGSTSKLTLSLNDKNLLYYDRLSFRVAQRYRSSGNHNPANTSQNFSVRLKDTGGNISPSLAVSLYSDVPYTDVRGFYTKSVLNTVTIPLRAFTANSSTVDIRHLGEMIFEFDLTTTGEVVIDDIEFLGLDISEPDI